MEGLVTKAREAIKNKLEALRMLRLRRRRAFASAIVRWLPQIRALLYVIGVAWLFLLPSSLLGRGIYVDENALQPGQVNTYWDWAEVHRADTYLAQLEELRDRNASSAERAEYLKTEFKKAGLAAATQSYRFLANSETISGVNAYAVLAAPRASGTEAMVLSATWRSRIDAEQLNLRGVATLLSLASYLKSYSHWARNIIFVIGDDHLPGVHAWLSAYHDAVQSNLEAQPLNISANVIWTALNIDYPGHSFSHLGVFHEGLNGRLPNLDLYSSISYIASRTPGVPVVLYDDIHSGESDSETFPRKAVVDYLRRAKAVTRHLSYQGSGKGSGAHGLYHRHRIDAVTIFAVPADGPHGFYSIGKVIESTLRTMNNLLERLHASLFFYILTGPMTLLKIGHYLPTVIFISVATMFGGLRSWVNAGWRKATVPGSKGKGTGKGKGSEEKWEPQRRPVTEVLLIMLGTHTFGATLFLLAWKGWAFQDGLVKLEMTLSSLLYGGIPFLAFATISSVMRIWISMSRSDASFAEVLVAFNLCLTSALISVTSVLNFSLAALLGIFLALPLGVLEPRASDGHRLRDAKQCLLFAYTAIAFNWALNRPNLWDWAILGNWFTPLVCVVYAPLLLQMGFACSLLHFI